VLLDPRWENRAGAADTNPMPRPSYVALVSLAKLSPAGTGSGPAARQVSPSSEDQNAPTTVGGRRGTSAETASKVDGSSGSATIVGELWLG
jgi:hypothetical protein